MTATRAIVMVLSLALLSGAGWASWRGLGSVSADAGAASVRAGSVGVGRIGGVRVK